MIQYDTNNNNNHSTTNTTTTQHTLVIKVQGNNDHHIIQQQERKYKTYFVCYMMVIIILSIFLLHIMRFDFFTDDRNSSTSILLLLLPIDEQQQNEQQQQQELTKVDDGSDSVISSSTSSITSLEQQHHNTSCSNNNNNNSNTNNDRYKRQPNRSRKRKKYSLMYDNTVHNGKNNNSNSKNINRWSACWTEFVQYPQYGCTNSSSSNQTMSSSSSSSTNKNNMGHFHVSQIPTTAMMVLIDNGIFPNITTTNDIYTSKHLQDSIPDIHVKGSQFYTLLYQIMIPIRIVHNPQVMTTSTTTSTNTTTSTSVSFKQKVFVQLAGIHYNATVWYNGIQLYNVQHQHFYTTTTTNRKNYPGAFVRHLYDLTSTFQYQQQQQQSMVDHDISGKDEFVHNNLFVIRIDPPFHSGTYTSHNIEQQLHLQQQGGSHDLAKDGATMQYMLGWDWCRPMPDRATGFFGSVSLLIYDDYNNDDIYATNEREEGCNVVDGHKTDYYKDRHRTDPSILNYPIEVHRATTTIENQPITTCTIHDPAIQTLDMTNCTWVAVTTSDKRDRYNNLQQEKKYFCSNIWLRVLVHIECDVLTAYDDDTSIFGVSDANLKKNQGRFILLIETDWGEHWTIPFNTTIYNNSGDEYIDMQENITVQYPEKVSIWWPHGMGIQKYAHRHIFNFTVLRSRVVTDAVSINVGIRTIETYLDHIVQGQRFRINHHDLYLVGGNWIGTDQALRYSASKERYCNEVLLHQYAGLNLIRVWGGGAAERDEFYDCTDEYGILVYQEFWMTGDNNGRWAGNYSWPYDYAAYLVNVEDTIKRLRYHSSLLFYGGCNECLSPKQSFWAPNPPRIIDDGIQTLINMFDPGRFYISSSMGGPNKADAFYEPSMYSNRSYSLAYADGPYGMLLPSTFFDRNPGLEYRNVSIGFQPEIGSVSVPTYSGMLKFMSKDEIETGYPRRNASAIVGDIWDYHNFLPWTTITLTNKTYDHVYTYFGPNYVGNASDWVSAAQIAAHVQYQHLFNGFITKMFTYTTSVIMWKTQSPWPSLRGFLYDWYLESTGSLTGVRSSLHSPISVAFDVQTWKLILVNRRVFPLSQLVADSIGATYSWITIYGKIVASNTVYLQSDIVPAMSYSYLGFDGLEWPGQCTDVCFLRVEGTEGWDFKITPSWYWMSNPLPGDARNYSQLGEMRKSPITLHQWDVSFCTIRHNKLVVELVLKLGSRSSFVWFFPTFSVFRKSDGSQLLPLFDNRVADQLVILPGTSHRRLLESPIYSTILVIEEVMIKMTSWNAPDEVRSCYCS